MAVSRSGHVVWKAVLDFKWAGGDHAIAEFSAPAGAVILHIARQQNQTCVWFSCFPEGPQAVQRLALVPTGGVIPDSPFSPEHLTTFLMDDDQFVWHIFRL